MQRCKQSGLLPARTEVQVLQPCVFQTDVLQDLPGPLTPRARERDVAREREKAMKMEGGWHGTERERRRRRKQGRLKEKTHLWTAGRQTSRDEVGAERRRRSQDFPVCHTWSSCPPSWWNPNHCSAHNADTNLHIYIFFLNFHFCEVELGSLFVGDVIFIIIIIIINSVVSLPWCLLFNESKVLDTSLTEDVPRRRTDGGEDSSLQRGGTGAQRVGLPSLGYDCDGAIGRQTFGFGALFRVNTLPIYRSNTTEKPHQCTVYLLYNSKQSWDIVLWSCLCQIVAYCHGRECNVTDFIFNVSVLEWKYYIL